MKFDIAFFVKGIPHNFLVWRRTSSLASIDQKAITMLSTHEKDSREIADFLRFNPSSSPVLAVFRIGAEDESKAIELAHAKMEALMDGYNLLAEETLKLCPIVAIRYGDSNDAIGKVYRNAAWASFHSKDPQSTMKWNCRKELMASKLMDYFAFATRSSVGDESEAEKQLRYSLQMFRFGTLASVRAVEFLCKFSALEGLVCGSHTSDKEKKLVERLTNLYDDESLLSRGNLTKTWIARCSASHQARPASGDDEDLNRAFLEEIIMVDRLFENVVYFILDQAPSYCDLDCIWSSAKGYTLPQIITDGRPHDMTKLGLLNLVLDTQITFAGLGGLMEAMLSKSK